MEAKLRDQKRIVLDAVDDTVFSGNPARPKTGRSMLQGDSVSQGCPSVRIILGEVGIMARQFSVIIEQDQDGYYVASVPALRGCHTQAKSLDELSVRVKEAIELCLEVEDNDAERLEFIGVQQVSVLI
jgi:predicted RNase H-like HicB family nuclease